ncbi:MAG: hypothetical protein GF317_08895 [Candidatus Lokiarchaeota archaeon]|nr:hypothetical protein [Candidatus Lokiarchaeota archaeon]MBD3199828.1 hypothetical protein [Candidatus Lokiarchaeota archaeon]
MISQTTLSILNSTLQSLGRYLAITIFTLMVLILLWRLIKERKETEKINYIRLITLLIFASIYFSNIWEFLGFETTIVPLEFIGFDAEDFSLYYFGLGLAVSLGILLTAYINQLKRFYFTSLFIFFGLFILFLYTGTSLIFLPYLYICGILALISQFYTGYKYRDNGAMGIAIFFAIAFITILLPEEGIIGLIDALMNLAYLTFGLIFALGYFRPYGQTEGE